MEQQESRKETRKKEEKKEKYNIEPDQVKMRTRANQLKLYLNQSNQGSGIEREVGIKQVLQASHIPKQVPCP
jgi:hypothetical protein